MRIFTVGHSTRAIEWLIKILTTHEVNILADVRSFPRSRTNPQFNSDTIEPRLAEHSIRYVWLQKLGGRRRGFDEDSRNTCWKNASFRNYADYMETPPFQEDVDELLQLAEHGTVVIMCAEAVYWRCHRSMIADYLKSLGIQATHILDEEHTREHQYTECARIRNGQLAYHD